MIYLGKVNSITLKVLNKAVDFNEIALNKNVPFEFNILRCISIILICLLIYSLKHNNFWKEPYSVKNKYQNIAIIVINCMAAIILTFFNGNCCYHNIKDLYSEKLVTALEHGQVSFLEEPSEKLLNLKNPYDYILRQKEGLQRNKDYIWDAALYDGKYYAYFGALPAVAIMIPFHLITGKLLSSSILTLIFSVLTAMLFVVLIEDIFKKYFPKLSFKYLAFSAIIMVFSTMLIWINLAPRFYELVTVAGLFFAVLGVEFIIKSDKGGKVSYSKVTLSALCMALAVACRPTQLLTSIIIVPFIWKILKNNLKEKKNITKLIICVGLPYLIVGIILMYYNYIRFGSVFDFGTGYQLTLNDMQHLESKISRIPTGLVCDLFNLPVFKATFPFIEKNRNIIDTFSYYYAEDIPAGVFILSPIAFFCFGLLKFLKRCSNKELKNLVISLIFLGLLLVAVISLKAGSTGRYFMDFAWTFVLAGIIIFMTNLEKTKTEEGKTILDKVLNVILSFTIIINLLAGFCDIGGNNSIKAVTPEVYYKTEYSIMFMK